MDQYSSRFTGVLAILGALFMLAGAAFWNTSETDLWRALETQSMDQHLSIVGHAKTMLVANTICWIFGVLLMTSAGRLMARFTQSHLGLIELAKTGITASTPMAITAFLTMLSLAIFQPKVDTAYVVAWIGTTLDDVATLFIIGYFPMLVSIANRKAWVPAWLFIWSLLAALTAIISTVCIVLGSSSLGFVIIPVGIGWMIAAGIVLIRR